MCTETRIQILRPEVVLDVVEAEDLLGPVGRLAHSLRLAEAAVRLLVRQPVARLRLCCGGCFGIN